MCHVTRLRTSGFILLGLLCTTSTVTADKNQDFQKAYKAYQQHINANDTPKAIKAAEQAYLFGSKVYGRNSINTANLAINYAMLLNDTRKSKQARKVLKGKLRILEKEYGKHSAELVPMLMELGRSHFDPARPRDGLKYFNRVTSILENHEDTLHRGRKNFDIVSFLLKNRANAHTRQFVEAAYEAYSDSLTPNDIRLGLAAYHMALWSTSDGRFTEAVAYLDSALPSFQTIGGGDVSSLERTARIMSIQILERTGQSNLATPHLLALGRGHEWKTPVRPLYMPAPEPGSIFGGDVELVFSIDDQGYVKQANVSGSTRPELNETALSIINGARFVPRFVDGKAVVTEGVSYTISIADVQQYAGDSQSQIIVNDPRPPLRDFPTPSVHDAQRDEILYPGLDADKERESTGDVYF